VTLHITQFEGGSALSSFRIQQLLPGLQAIHDKIVRRFGAFCAPGGLGPCTTTALKAQWPPC
jgi:hypothetical protein